MDQKWLKRRKRIFEIIEVGNDLDRPSRIYDFVNVFAMIVNLLVAILCTYAELLEKYGDTFHVLENITVLFFACDYILRVWTARFLHKDLNEWHADNYPAMIEQATGGEYKVCYAYGHVEPPADWQKSNEQWAKDLLNLLKLLV